jgi:predicted RNA-binding Zn-ribbon protein involved in translation (DUF1610 family)
MATTYPCPACGTALRPAELLDAPPPKVEVYRDRQARYCPHCGAAVDLRVDLRWDDVVLIVGVPLTIIIAKHRLVPDLLPMWLWSALLVAASSASLPITLQRRRRLVRFGERPSAKR